MARSPLVDIALAYMPAQVICTAAKLGLADLLAEKPLSSAELAEELDAHAPSMLRLMRALTALGVLSQTGPDRFELTELGGHLRSGTDDSVRDFVTMVGDPESWQSWGDLGWSLRTGEPAFNRVTGMPLFEYLGRNPDKAATFGGAMSRVTQDMAPGILAAFDFSRFETIVDVGGGNGTLLSEILKAVPQARGVLLDLPSGVAQAPQVLEAAGVADRCQVVAGDFFDSVPEGGDAYLMKSTLHDWDDDRAVAILRNCREAMGPGGRVLIVEPVIPDLVTPEIIESLMIDLYMLVSPGGRERTEAEYADLLTRAGFTLATVTGPIAPFNTHVVEGAPA